jgi:hypothetical protein
MLLRAAAAATNWLRIWSVTGTLDAGPVVVVVDDRGTELPVDVLVEAGPVVDVVEFEVADELEQPAIASAAPKATPAAVHVRILIVPFIVPGG